MMNLVVLDVYDNLMEANLVKGKLLSSGIQCFLSDENIVRLNPLYIQAVGGIKLFVLKQDEELAKELIKPSQEYMNENSCPACGSENILTLSKKRNIFNWAGLFVSMLTGTAPLYNKKVNTCQHCKLEFDKEE